MEIAGWGGQYHGREMEYTVDFLWDDKAQVWDAKSDEIPGLVLEETGVHYPSAKFEDIKAYPNRERCNLHQYTR